MGDPRLLEFGKFYAGKHYKIWVCDHVPEGMRKAEYRDLWPGRRILVQCALPGQEGEYLATVATPGDMESLKWHIDNGFGVWVK